MLPKDLINPQHPFVKYLVKIREDRSFRREEGKVLVTGRNLIQELLKDGSPVEALFLAPGCSFPSFPSLAVPVSEAVLKKITGLVTPDGSAALVSMPSFHSLAPLSRLLILDGISDPGNLGSLLRTALAFGWDGAFLTKGCCDPFNDKALRAAKGATFRLPLEEGSLSDLLEKNPKRKLLIADLEGKDPESLPAVSPIGLLLSREGQGVRKEIATKASDIVSLKMTGPMESLNVALAGAVLLYLYRKGGDLEL